MEKQYIDIDVQRTCLQQRFFEHLRFDSSDELIAALRGIEVDLDTLAQSHDLRYYLYSGWGYWLLYAKGYLQYLETGTIGRGNIYYDYLTNYYVPRGHDPGLCKELRIPFKTIERVAQRYRDLDFFRIEGACADGEIYKLAPIRLIVGEPPPSEEALLVYAVGQETPLVPRLIDGWHRLFAAKLYGRATLRAELVAQDRQPHHIRGAIEQFCFDGQRLQIQGWCLDPQRVIESVEVRVEGKTVAQTGISFRPDVRQAFDMIPHSIRSGFCVDQEVALLANRPICFQLLPLSDWLPVGMMAAYYLPGIEAAASNMAQIGEPQLKHQSGQPAFQRLKCLQEMLNGLVPYRDPASFTAALDWGMRNAIGQECVSQLLPNARITSVDDGSVLERYMRVEHPEQIRAGSIDLVLAYSVLTRLAPEAQNAWLEEMHRLLQPGGYLVAGIFGALLQPFLTAPALLKQLETNGIGVSDAPQCIIGEPESVGGYVTYQTKPYTVQTYAHWFEVVNYIEGGLNDIMDLIVLRKG